MKRSERDNLKKWVDYLMPLVKYNPNLSDNPTPEEIAHAESIELGCTRNAAKPSPDAN